MQPAGNQTPQAESVGDQRFSETTRMTTAIVILCCAFFGAFAIYRTARGGDFISAFIFLVLTLCAFECIWQLVAGPVKDFLREISEPFDVWDD